MSKSDPITERYHDKNCLGSPYESLSDDNARWLAGQDWDIDSVVRIHRIRQENPDLALGISQAVQEEEHRPIILAIAQGGGATIYDEIEPFVSVSRRTVKRRVKHLQKRNVVRVDTDAKPAVIYFPNDVVDVLVRDCLNLFFTNTNTLKQT